MLLDVDIVRGIYMDKPCKLTQSHKDIYEFILYFAKKENSLPSVTEISIGTGLTRNTVDHALHRLAKLGMVKFRTVKSMKMYSVTRLKYVEVKDSEV